MQKLANKGICMKDETGNCLNCNATFVKVTKNQKYCSRSCGTLMWKKKNPARWKEIYQKSHDMHRNNLFQILGDKCSCGFDDKRALQFDHINENGLKDLKRFGNKNAMLYYYSKHPEEAREKLQILCANCNWIKRAEKNEIRGVA